MRALKVKTKDVIFIITLIIAIIFIVIFSTDRQVKLSNNPEMVDFKVIKNKYFIQYHPKLKSSLERPSNITVFMQIHRDHLSEAEMGEIQQRLVADGWREVEHNDNYFAYCLNKNQLLSILSPIVKELKTIEGKIIHNEDIDSWSIGFYANKNGISSCQKA